MNNVPKRVVVINPAACDDSPRAADGPGRKRLQMNMESTDMKQVNEKEFEVAGDNRDYSDECAQGVQTAGKVKMSHGGLKRLLGWVAKCVEAHNNRVVALNVYRRDRLDGSSQNGSPIDRAPQTSAGSRPV